jgi:hypothetical protein
MSRYPNAPHARLHAGGPIALRPGRAREEAPTGRLILCGKCGAVLAVRVQDARTGCWHAHFEPGWSFDRDANIWYQSAAALWRERHGHSLGWRRAPVKLPGGASLNTTPSPTHYPTYAKCPDPWCGKVNVLDAAALDVVAERPIPYSSDTLKPL